MKTHTPDLDDLLLNLGIAARHATNHLTAAQSDLVIAVSREITALQLGKTHTDDLRQLIDAMRPFMVTEDSIDGLDAMDRARGAVAAWLLP
jgi:hypothetical protein